MSDWLPVSGAFLCALLVLWVPGGLVVRVLGVRGVLGWGIAPVVTGAIAAAAAMVAPALGLRWSAWVLVGATGVVLLLSLLVRLWLRPATLPSSLPPRRLSWAVGLSTAVGLAVSFVLGVARFVGAVPDPSRVAQTYDTAFHLNSVQMMLETGDASSLHMTLAYPGQSVSFYPAMWHGLVSLIVQVSGVGVAQATNVLALVVAFVVWPVSLAALARALFGARPLLVGLTAMFALLLPQFPVRLLSFGILYPTLLAYAFLPAVLAMFVLAVDARGPRARVLGLLLGVTGWGALALAQTSAAFALMFLLVPLLFHALAAWSTEARRRGRRRSTVVSVWVLVLGAAALAYALAGRVSTIAAMRSKVDWPETLSLLGALRSAVTFSSIDPVIAPSWIMAVLVLVGTVAALRRRAWRWIPFGYLVLLVLYVVSRASPAWLRTELTGYWYGDAPRLAGLLPVLAVPLAALGAVALVQAARLLVARFRPSWRPTGAVLLACGLVAGLVGTLLVSRMQPTEDADRWMAWTYRVDPDAESSVGLLDADEQALLDEVDEIVPEGVRIAGNPWNGSALVWALAEREAVFPHLNMSFDVPRAVVAERLNEARVDPTVCEAVEDLGLGYVLDMGPSLWGGDPAGRDARFGGLEGLVESGVAEVVATEGDAELLRITACD
ncbi:hypothetical protein H9623_04345 [Oerskovia sp. Sa1BUA8]|uniref:Uncharacterized protein n=1 Tax=Oerskovia douganii TaxID=2762210 RepID=A0A9D5UFC0_9CELL|nr:DUF6541 family protein [Oerskovia douganii]MBE7699537.1 hypothetical protein [Oerskovia douganii]